MSRKARVLESGVCEVTQEYKGNAHRGIDIVREGYQLDNIVAHSDGTVVQVINNCNVTTPNDPTNPGNMVKIDHNNGYQTRYLHLAYNTVKVAVGQKVSKGQILGYMGNTGNSFGAHLHFEVMKDNAQIDPTNYLDSDLPNTSVMVTGTVDELARDVIAGKYGNGEDRKRALGSRYAEVQARVNEMLAPKVNYLHNPSYTGVSIVDGLKGIGVDSSYEYRSRLANANGISNYCGSAEQNTQMLEMLKNGTLKSV